MLFDLQSPKAEIRFKTVNLFRCFALSSIDNIKPGLFYKLTSLNSPGVLVAMFYQAILEMMLPLTLPIFRDSLIHFPC